MTDARHEGRRFDDVVAEWLAAAWGEAPSRSAVRRWIMAGAVRVDGRALRAPGRPLAAGLRLEADVRAGLRPRPPAPPPIDGARVLFEDDALIAVDKPAGLPTVATADPLRPHLVSLVQAWLARRRPEAAPPYVGVHQRLDRDTSGVVLFTKDAAANAGLAAQFARRSVAKTYLALTTRPSALPRSPWTADRPLRGAPEGTGDGEAARTDFAIVEEFPRALLVEARPRTGRKHQVRIHLAQAGMPILGDGRYGGEGRAPRTMLHAQRLELRHPITGATLAIESPLPEDFRRVLSLLRGEGEAGPARRRP